MGKKNSELADGLIAGGLKIADLSDKELSLAQRTIAKRSDSVMTNLDWANRQQLSKLSLALKDEIAARQNRSEANGEVGGQESPPFELECQSELSADVPEFPDLGDIISFSAHQRPDIPDSEQHELPLVANA
ncbi:MAG: hypothetical protein RL538_690 [Candidatus Parcubacteria bacterium]|jgi:hypothetical protein